MIAVTFQVKLLEPCLFSDLSGDPNSAASVLYIPGSAMRGLLVGRYIRAGGTADAADADFQRLFLNGSTRFLNGYPTDRAQRSLPVPLAWRRNKALIAKQPDTPLMDHSVEPPDDSTTQWVSAGAPFCAFIEIEDEIPQTIRLLSPDTTISIHTSRARSAGRATRTDGAVYRYVALAEGQTFSAAVICDTLEDADLLHGYVEGEARLGGSKTAGYGRVVLQDAVVSQNWSERPLEMEDTGDLVVTLLSHALVRNSNGHFVAEAEAVRAALQSKTKVTLPDPSVTFLAGEAVGGFNRTWGLPLPQATATAMGSVFVFPQVSLEPDAVRKLEAEGIGERRAEGFGRLMINAYRQEEWGVALNSASDTTVPDLMAPGADAASRALAREISARLLRRHLDRELIRRANELAKPIKTPTPSQIGRLRLAIQNALLQQPHEGRAALRAYLDSVQNRGTTRRQFQDQVAGRSLLEWLHHRTNDGSTADPPSIFAGDGELPAQNAPNIGQVAADRTPELVYEYNLRLMDATLALAAKRKRQPAAQTAGGAEGVDDGGNEVVG